MSCENKKTESEVSDDPVLSIEEVEKMETKAEEAEKATQAIEGSLEDLDKALKEIEN